MTLALELAHRINSLSYDELPPAAIHAAKVGILDYVGVALAGAAEDTTRIPAGVLLRGASGGASLVFGGNARVNALDAALLTEKFESCARRALPAERVGRLYSAIQGFENLKEAREVTAIIAGEGGRAQAVAA